MDSTDMDLKNMDCVRIWTYYKNMTSNIHNSTGSFDLPCTVSTQPVGQNTESNVLKSWILNI